MKKKYIKPTIIIIKTCNDDALCSNMVSASLYDINKRNPIANSAGEGGAGGEDGPIIGDDGNIWND